MKDRFGFDWSRINGRHFWKGPHLGRRMFFQHVASAVGGYMLLPGRPMEKVAKASTQGPKGTAKNVIFVLMTGAPSHTDTFDLKVGAWTPSTFNPTPYANVLFPQGLFPTLATQMNNISLVRSIRSWAAVHGLAQTWVQIGRNPTNGLSKIAPHIGSVVSMELSPSNKVQMLPTFVALNTGTIPGAGYFPSANAPFYISPGGAGLANSSHPDGQAAYNRRYSMLTDLEADFNAAGDIGAGPIEMAQWNLAARKLMYNPTINSIFTFDQTEKNRYGNTGFGNACIAARNMLAADVGTRFVQISIGSWDHHQQIYQTNSNLNSMAKQFDMGLGTLIADLKASGQLDNTLIVAMGEFGRTVGPLNNQNGRDHYLQQAALIAGGGTRGGRAVGQTDSIGAYTTDPGWSRARDIRPEDIEATIYSALGIDWTTVRHDDPLGRGFEYVPFAQSEDLYGPVDELW